VLVIGHVLQLLQLGFLDSVADAVHGFVQVKTCTEQLALLDHKRLVVRIGFRNGQRVVSGAERAELVGVRRRRASVCGVESRRVRCSGGVKWEVTASAQQDNRTRDELSDVQDFGHVGTDDPRRVFCLGPKRLPNLLSVQIRFERWTVEDLLGSIGPYGGRTVEFQRPSGVIQNQISAKKTMLRRFDDCHEPYVWQRFGAASGHRGSAARRELRGGRRVEKDLGPLSSHRAGTNADFRVCRLVRQIAAS